MKKNFPLTLYFDGACQLCRAEMRNLALRDSGNQLRFVDISDPAFVACPAGMDRAAMMSLIHATRPDGSILRGVEVFRLAYTAVGLPWVARITALPLIRPLCEALYPVIARNRHRLPAAPVRWLFEISLRRAAERATRAHCEGETCRAPLPPGNKENVS